ncbi:hypothetical protein AN221_34950, partial [Streptomyces nanshensis]
TGASERGRGHGLGLTVAQGQAGVLGARPTFANAPDGGAIATLDLAPERPEGPEGPRRPEGPKRPEGPRRPAAAD